MRHRIILSLLFFSLTVFYQTLKAQKSLSGKIVKIADANTFVLLDSLNIYRTVILVDVKSPVKGQPYEKDAKSFVSKLLNNKKVQVDYLHQKSSVQLVYGTILVDSMNVNKELIKRGYAWYHPFRERGYEYQLLQREAQADKVGLWKDPRPVPPWEWEKKKRKNDLF